MLYTKKVQKIYFITLCCMLFVSNESKTEATVGTGIYKKLKNIKENLRIKLLLPKCCDVNDILKEKKCF